MDEAEIIKELGALVSDSSQSVSYKWLSRKFSVSSNAAKRLLEKFVHAHGGGLDVVYVLSGWTQEQPRSYSIQLVKEAQLEGAKASLGDDLSVHIYSVQSCLPGDPAMLWSSDHAQAEQLFNDPPHVLNCLRDNRFSGVTCTFVTRDLKGKGVQDVPLKPVLAEEAKPALKHTAKPSGKADEAAAGINGAAKAGGSSKAPLQSLWSGRKQSPKKPEPQKPVVPETTEIRSSDDDDDEIRNFSRLRRGGNKRRIILDDEGDELNEPELNEHSVVSLISPEKKKSPDQSKVSKAEENGAATSEPKKRRRLVKSRIDERGREVTEVVWDTAGETSEAKPEMEKPKPEAEKPKPEPKPEVAAAPPARKQPVKSKVASKPATKSGKGGKGGPQQGSITSFFKKQ